MMTLTPDLNRPMVKSVLVADVKCYLCGASSGSVESEKQPLPRSVNYRPAGAKEAMPVLDWRRLRCERCNGPIYLDETEVVTRRVENVDWLEDRPRRGRPPKRLVEERRRQRELEEKQRRTAA